MKKRLGLVMVLALVGGLSMGVIDRYDLSVGVQPWQFGKYTYYKNFAAEEWRTDVPDRPDSAAMRWKIIGEYNGNHQFVWYYDGSFRGASGGKWSKPARWAYLRPQEEHWNGRTWVLSDGSLGGMTDTYTLAVGDLDGAVALLMSRWTVKEIMDSMDRNKGLEGTGAPEE